MMASRHDCPLDCPDQADLDRFLQAGVDVMSLARPWAMKVGHGYVADDGRFEPAALREKWFAFDEYQAGDIVFWRRQTGELASWRGRAFALGQDVVDSPSTYAFNNYLAIYADPLDWLRAKREGIVVLDWSRAFDRLRNCPGIAVCSTLLTTYQKAMKPAHLPKLAVLDLKKDLAA